MGLDMYFSARKRSFKSYGAYEAKQGVKDLTHYPKDLKVMGDYIAQRNFKSVTATTDYDIGYFRKFNALHAFIVDHFAGGKDECQDIRLTKSDVSVLKEACRQVLAEPESAAELMPTRRGCFFGSLEYDDWYFDNMEEAERLFGMILENVDFDKYDIIYIASW